jgi:gas vesicle protein
METKERKHSNFFAGLLVGGFLGGLTGLLLAPKSGRELRADIRTTGQRTREETKAFIGKASHQVSGAGQKARNIWSCVKGKGEGAPQYRPESVEDYVGEA